MMYLSAWLIAILQIKGHMLADGYRQRRKFTQQMRAQRWRIERVERDIWENRCQLMSPANTQHAARRAHLAASTNRAEQLLDRAQQALAAGNFSEARHFEVEAGRELTLESLHYQVSLARHELVPA